VAGAEQDPQCLTIAVGPRQGEPVGIQTQGGEHREMSVDRVGLALPAARLAVGLLRLDDRDAAAATARASPTP
jgi:hypothetical protein